MLYLIATPIGNLTDITFRAIETLKNCDYILCEDTRHSQVLLKRYEIRKPLKSFHQFCEASKEDLVVADLRAGKQIALITDAGTPGISDPGSRLVKRCRRENLHVFSLPGPCAAIAALSSSGLEADRFQFLGFLPRKAGELKRTLAGALEYPGTTVCYESPKRVEKALRLLNELDPERILVIARELTKKFEEFCQGTAEELLARYASRPPKGEIVLLISASATNNKWKQLTPKEHVLLLQETYHLSKKEAIKMAGDLRGVSKREIYNQVIES
jgi:16S rRNA (cytidine1402-2'-O)-methyltransferase